ncbi:hypothetical protein [Taklimakanibacter deserti]|uniref:hypothetical protein n=1 Tax=Taklimakanibacter deserti TaxID=2267839 RepID=UPI000E659BC3
MLIRLLIVALAVVLVSLLLRLKHRFEAAPPWLRILHLVIFYGALAYAVIFAAVFVALHLFGYRL